MHPIMELNYAPPEPAPLAQDSFLRFSEQEEEGLRNKF